MRTRKKVRMQEGLFLSLLHIQSGIQQSLFPLNATLSSQLCLKHFGQVFYITTNKWMLHTLFAGRNIVFRKREDKTWKNCLILNTGQQLNAGWSNNLEN